MPFAGLGDEQDVLQALNIAHVMVNNNQVTKAKYRNYTWAFSDFMSEKDVMFGNLAYGKKEGCIYLTNQKMYRSV